MTAFANGGVLGEAGPEAVVPLSRGRGVGSGTVVNITVTGNSFTNERDFERMMDRVLVKYGRLGLAS